MHIWTITCGWFSRVKSNMNTMFRLIWLISWKILFYTLHRYCSNFFFWFVIYWARFTPEITAFLIRPRSPKINDPNAILREFLHLYLCVCVCIFRYYYPTEFDTNCFCLVIQDIFVLLPKLTVGESKNSRNVE